MICSEKDISRAIDLADLKHIGQTNMLGYDYFAYHVVPVANTSSIIALNLFDHIMMGGCKIELGYKCYRASFSNACRLVGYLHDVGEDCGMSIFEIISAIKEDDWDSEKIHIFDSALCAITKQPSESYHDYIHRLVESGSVIAMVVKLADLSHNLSTDNIVKHDDFYFDKRDIKRMNKYLSAYRYINAYLNGLSTDKFETELVKY